MPGACANGSVEKLAKQLNISPHVKCIGFVPQKDLPVLYASASMFVFPSHYEGFGMPVLEAMSQVCRQLHQNIIATGEIGR